MNARTENDLLALLPALLANAKIEDRSPQDVARHIIRLIKKCDELNDAAETTPEPTPTEPPKGIE